MINKLHFSRSIYLFILLSMLAFSLVAEEEIQIESIDAKSISTLEDESLLMEGSVKIITNKFDLETSKAIYNNKFQHTHIKKQKQQNQGPNFQTPRVLPVT